MNVFACFGNKTRRGIVGSYGNSRFSFLRNCQVIFQWLHKFTFPPAMYEDSGFPASSPSSLLLPLPLHTAVLVRTKGSLLVFPSWVALDLSASGLYKFCHRGQPCRFNGLLLDIQAIPIFLIHSHASLCVLKSSDTFVYSSVQQWSTCQARPGMHSHSAE